MKYMQTKTFIAGNSPATSATAKANLSKILLVRSTLVNFTRTCAMVMEHGLKKVQSSITLACSLITSLGDTASFALTLEMFLKVISSTVSSMALEWNHTKMVARMSVTSRTASQRASADLQVLMEACSKVTLKKE